jgi:hypothetical protein
MSKPAKTTKSQSPFERFQSLTKALIAVPKKKLQEKLDKYKRQKKLNIPSRQTGR